jgi:hypothetical protein
MKPMNQQIAERHFYFTSGHRHRETPRTFMLPVLSDAGWNVGDVITAEHSYPDKLVVAKYRVSQIVHCAVDRVEVHADRFDPPLEPLAVEPPKPATPAESLAEMLSAGVGVGVL